MLKRIAMQLSGRLMALCTQVLAWLTTRLWNPAKHLLVSSTQVFLSAINRLNLLAQMALNFKALLVNLTTVAQSIKPVLTTVKAKSSQIGSQLQTTVRQILLPVTTAFKKSKELVALIKLAVSRISASKTVLTLTVRQWIQVGLKLLGIASQHRLVAYLLQQLEKVRVVLTNLVQSCTKKIVAALTHMANRLKAIGLKLQGNVHLLLQPVLRLQSLSKKPVEKTKLAQYLLKKAVAVLTRMVYLLKVIGLKQVETAPQPQQPAQRQRSKGH
jgi:hypothetical protein